MTRLRPIRPAHECGDKTAAICPPAQKLPRKINRPAFFPSPVCPPRGGPCLSCARRRARGRMCTPSIRAANGVRTGRTTVVRSGDEPSSPGPAGWFDPLTCGRIRLGAVVHLSFGIGGAVLGHPGQATGRAAARPHPIFYRATPPAARLPQVQWPGPKGSVARRRRVWKTRGRWSPVRPHPEVRAERASKDEGGAGTCRRPRLLPRRGGCATMREQGGRESRCTGNSPG